MKQFTGNLKVSYGIVVVIFLLLGCSSPLPSDSIVIMFGKSSDVPTFKLNSDLDIYVKNESSGSENIYLVFVEKKEVVKVIWKALATVANVS